MFLLSIFLLGCIQHSQSAIAVVGIGVSDLLTMQMGLGWPHSLQVVEGQNALLQLNKFKDVDSCSVRSAIGEEFDVNSLPDRYEKWSEGCGVRIKDIVAKDEGRWRLTATRGNDSYVGWVEVDVEALVPSYRAADINLSDGQSADVSLTTLDNSYCFVEQPFSEGSLVAGQCHVNLNRATRAVQGNWNVYLGIPGQVQELHIERRVVVEAERLDVGYVYDQETNKLHLYCNLLHSDRNITFCRFQKTSSSSGFNVVDGLSDGKHSYYGEGFLKRDCGMTIEDPASSDYGTWRCSIGSQKYIDNKIVQQTPMQALISVALARSANRVNRDVGDEADVTTVFAQADQQFTLSCSSETALRYCWFQHPNGSQYTPVTLSSENQTFWYTGQSLQSGECGITFSHASAEHSGKWTCHMGRSDKVGIEDSAEINLRVTGPLAANRHEIGATIGSTVTLYCHTANGNKVLEYCRFVSPKFLGVTLDPGVTETNAILGRYYFTPGRQIDHGDCSLTIKHLEDDDFGEWTCAALIDQEIAEARDTILVYYDGSIGTSLSSAGIIGMTFGFLLLVLILAGLILYRRYGSSLFSRSTSNRGTPNRGTSSTVGFYRNSGVSSIITTNVVVDTRHSIDSNNSSNSSGSDSNNLYAPNNATVPNVTD